jgi:hypothetical protein
MHTGVSGPQMLPHVPQLFESLVRSTQFPPQLVVPGGHVHVPDEHVWPPLQTFPHEPQLFWSVVKSMHTPLHSFVPCGHWQLPPAHR